MGPVSASRHAPFCKPGGLITARTVDDALAALETPGAQALAGGTDVWPALGDRPARGTLVDITRIPGLRGITQSELGWRIGACTTWRDIALADLPPAFRGLQAAAREVGAVQIQAMGTIAGNLCTASPAADGVPALLTLNASVDIAGPEGMRSLPLPDFIIDVRQTALRPGEIVTAVTMPHPAPSTAAAFEKLGARKHLVISIAMAAATVRMDGDVIASTAVAVGSCARVARRLAGVERALKGVPLSAVRRVVTPKLLPELTPIDDVRGTAQYRRDAATELVRRAVLRAANAVSGGLS